MRPPARRASTPRQSIAPGLACIAIGTVVAVALVPDDYTPAGALFWPGAVMAASFVAPVALRLRRELATALRIENVLLLGLIYWLLLDLLQSAYPIDVARLEDVRTAFWSIGIFAFALWLGAGREGWGLPAVIHDACVMALDKRTLVAAIGVCFAIAMVKFAAPSGFNPITMYNGVLSTRWEAPWSRGQLGGADAFLDHLGYFGLLVPSLCVLLARRVGWLNPATVAGIVLAVVMILFFGQSGGRRIVGVMVGTGILTWIMSQSVLKPRLIAGAAVGAVALLKFMEVMLSYRSAGFGAWMAGERLEASGSYWHVDDNFLRLAQTIRFIPDVIDYVYYKPVYHALVLPIPRVVWEGKPIDQGYSLTDQLGVTGVSLTTSVIGEFYASWGLMAVFVGGYFFGRLAAMWNRTLVEGRGEGRALVFSAGLMALFAGLRAMEALVQMSYVVLAFVAVAYLLRARAGAPR
jgi:hypothetical protein